MSTNIADERPEPGRPTSHGAADDAADADAVRGVLEATRARPGAVRIVREAIWFSWEQPRLPRPLVASKYSLAYPWSVTALERYERRKGKRPAGGWGLVIEHLYPRELLVADLFEIDGLTTPAVVDLLSTRLISVIITKDENRQLPARGPAESRWSDFAADPWLRYRATDIKIVPGRSSRDGATPQSAAARALEATKRRSSDPYVRFWRGLTARIAQEHPEWPAGRPNRNDLRLMTPLPGARIKCNFSRQGLRVELPLESTDQHTNDLRLDVLRLHLDQLQHGVGDAATLRVEPLKLRTQARIAMYLPGTIGEERRWREFETWFIATAASLKDALAADQALNRDWPDP
jgi:hypothetical protein